MKGILQRGSWHPATKVCRAVKRGDASVDEYDRYDELHLCRCSLPVVTSSWHNRLSPIGVGVKVRAVLIAQNDFNNHRFQDVILALITSTAHPCRVGTNVLDRRNSVTGA